MKARRKVRRDEEFGNRLTKAMDDLPIKPSALARELGVTDVTVSRWRAGQLPDRDRVPQLAQILGVSEAWLWRGNEGAQSASALAQSPLQANILSRVFGRVVGEVTVASRGGAVPLEVAMRALARLYDAAVGVGTASDAVPQQPRARGQASA
jgi:transcriptional regulator with XRE-family HTH domain